MRLVPAKSELMRAAVFLSAAATSAGAVEGGGQWLGQRPEGQQFQQQDAATLNQHAEGIVAASDASACSMQHAA